MIFTSYLANVRNLDSSLHPIFIASRWPNNTKLFGEYKTLAPAPKLIGAYIRKEITSEEYTVVFNEMLSKLSPTDTVFHLMQLSGVEKDPCLICYEKPGDFCHRHLVSKWFNSNDIQCSEVGYPLELEFF